MEFQLRTSGYFYTEESSRFLTSPGFRFVPISGIASRYGTVQRDMLVTPRLCVETLEALLRFTQECGCPLVLMHDEDGWTLEIYDSYRE